MLEPSNISSNGYALADIHHISGGKSVQNIDELLSLYDWQLSPSKSNENNDAIGCTWYVIDKQSFYYLIKWDSRHDEEGWKKICFDGTADINGTPNSIAVFDANGDLTSGGRLTNTLIGASPTDIPTVQAVISNSSFGGIKIKGTIGNDNSDLSELPTEASVGDAYLVSMYQNTYGEFDGILCETSDIIFCYASEDNTVKWSVIQGNLHIATQNKLGSIKLGRVFSENTASAIVPLSATSDGEGYVSIPKANKQNSGVIRLGYESDEETHNYSVQVDNNNNAYVNVPWESYSTATQLKDGLLSKEDKAKLDSFSASGIQYEKWETSTKINLSI